MSASSRICLLALLVAATWTLPAAAADWRARVHGQWVSSSGELLADDLSDGVGLYLGAEYRLSDRWGVEVGLGLNELEADQRLRFDFFGFSIVTDIEATVQSTPLTAAVNYYLTPRSAHGELYVAPMIGWAFLDVEVETRIDVDFPFAPPGIPILVDDVGTNDLPVDDSFLYGLRLGFDWPIGDAGWSVSSAVDYSVIELESSSATATDLDPLRVGVGFARSF